MTLQDFINNHNNKPLNYDNAYGNQCMDLYHFYVQEVLPGFPHPALPGAAWLWNNYDRNFYDRIDNTITAVPRPGDILIWGTKAGGGFGHVAVYVSGNVLSFTSFDQNWPSQGYYDSNRNFIGTGVCHLQNHNYFGGLLGWLRPKQQNLTDDQKESKIREILGKQETSTQHIQSIEKIIHG